MLSASFLLRKNCVVLVISLFIKGVTNVITMLCFLTYLLSLIAPGRAQAIDNPRQRTWTWAFPSVSFQLYPICFSSASVFRFQLFLGFPFFLFPWGFHLRACGVMLFGAFRRRVWPIQPHFLLEICSPIGCCFPRCHSSSFANFLRPPNAKDTSQGSTEI